METRIQTAFRLDAQLVARLKKQAKKEHKSLNSYVEAHLERLAPAEPEWPKVSFPVEISPEVEAMKGLLREPSEEELVSDARLTYILSR